MKSARPLLRFVGTAAATLLAAASNAAEPDYAADLPRIPQVPPAAAAATMRVQPGFALDLAVHEPLVASPVAIAWDEDGRLFVAEMRGYSEQRGENLGRIRMLHDDDRDGRFDRATIFAEGLGWPTAVVVSRGGLFVGDAPDILRLVDTDDDGVADVRQTVFTGFGTGNVQGLFNSFAVGLDNRIHAAGSSVGGAIRRVDAEGRPVGEAVSIAGRDFSFDPRTLDLRPETGGAQHGRSTDDVGNVYVCHNSDHCIRCMVDDRFVSGNPFFPAPAAKVSVAVEGPQAAVYRASPVEPWRILRTRLRASGITPGLVEGGGRPAGYFTSATGITVVRGDAVGDLAGMLVVGDVGSNLVHRKRLTPSGAGVQAARVDRDGELVASTDLWFRPVQYANGPDGALWIVDMQREVIEHPQSLPPPIKKHLDLTSGRETGRLWRLVAVPRDRSQPHPPRRLPPRLSRATTPELVRLLAHANGWHRDTAHRLLVERADPAAASLLQAVCRDQAAPPLARLHAAHAAVGLGMLAVDDVLALLGAADARVRQCGVHVSDVLLAHESFPEPLGRRLATLADDEPAIEVRFSLALTARRLPDEARVAVVRRLLERDGDDDWVRYAAFTSLRGEAGMIIETWLRDPRTQSLPGVTAALPGLVAQVGRRRDAAELTRLIAALDGLVGRDATNAADAQTLAIGLLEQLASAIGGTLDAIQPTKTTRSLVARLVSWNRGIALDTSADVEARLRGVRGLALGGVAELQPLLRTDTPARLLDAAIAAIASSRDPEIGRVVALALPGLPAAQRRAAAAILVRDAQGATALLDAVAGGTMTATDLEPTTARALWSFPEATVARRSLELLGPPPAANREPLVAAYRASLPPEGDAVTGNAIFRKQCVSCHRVAGEGRELGPNLAAMQARGPDAMLLGILDPNREVLPAYLAHTAVTDDGRVVTGVVAEQSVGSLTLRTADGMDVTLARSDVESLVNTKRSLMPEGFEKTITPKEMADLLTYLMSVK